MQKISPFLLNAIIDDNIGEVIIKEMTHRIEVLENKVNAITCPTTGKHLDYRHLIQDPTTNAVWNPEMAKEVDRLVSTRKTRFLKKKNIPQGEKAVYTRLVVYLRPNKAVHEILRMCMGEDEIERVMETTTRTADLITYKLHMNGVV